MWGVCGGEVGQGGCGRNVQKEKTAPSPLRIKSVFPPHCIEKYGFFNEATTENTSDDIFQSITTHNMYLKGNSTSFQWIEGGQFHDITL